VGQFDLCPDADEQTRQYDQHQIQWIEIKHKLVQLTARWLFSFNQAGRVPGWFPSIYGFLRSGKEYFAPAWLN
jgi:hypothetical protein